MILLHIYWCGHGFAVWAEQSVSMAQFKRYYPLSPFDVDAQTLRKILNPFLQDSLASGHILCELFLPTVSVDDQKIPLPSRSVLLRDCALPARIKPVLEVWQTTGILLDWRQLIGLLAVCKERRLTANIFAGEDLLALAQLFRYAGALVAQGKYLPGLEKIGDSRFAALWQPVLNYTDTQRLKELSGCLPALFLQGRDKSELAATILAELVDQLVRVSVVTMLSRSHAERGSYYSAHDAWFAALRGEQRLVRWNYTHELENLYTALALWRRPCAGGQQAGSLPAFQLSEGCSADDSWFLHIADAYDTQRADALYSEEYLLALGQAAMLFTALASARHYKRGLGCRLTPSEAYAFMTYSAPLLETAGYHVRLPEWWHADAEQSLALEVEVAPEADRGSAEPVSSELVHLKWHVTFHGAMVTATELDVLLQAQSPLVFFRGRWIVINIAQLQEAKRILQRGEKLETHAASEIVRLALGGGSHTGLLDVAMVRGHGWLDTFFKRMQGEYPFEILATPQGFCGVLRPYQQRGFSWLVFLRQWRFGACLADDMGLGKTIQAIAFLLHEKARGQRSAVLLVAPMSVLGNWQREVARFAPELRCMLHHGAQRRQGDEFVEAVKSYDVILTSFQLLYRDYATLRRITWSGVLLDEAQNIKNPSTRQAQAARALEAEYRLALTGTPVENHVEDLWSIMDFLNPGMLGKRSLFREKYLRPIQASSDPGARSRLRRITQPFILRRLKTDKQIINDLPEKLEAKVVCNLTREQARLYEEVLGAFQQELGEREGLERRGLILAVLTHLKQICNHPANYLGERAPLARRSGKLKRLEEMLDEVFTRGESALVFTQYAEMGHLLRQHLCETFGVEVPYLHGGTPRKERDRIVREFQDATEATAFVLSLKAGGIGLNLTHATHVFHYDRWWNPAVEDQATDRAFRIGQTRKVMVYKFICGGTLEERIDAIIERKRTLAGEIVGDGESFLTELTDAELTEALRLSEAIIEEHE